MTDVFRTDREGPVWGRSLRKHVARSSHGEWAAPADRQDPVVVITSQNATRLPSLVPIRHSRMSESPFAFYRGGAKLMALDLAATPTSGLTAQICGDAHLSNFGVYGSPDRELIFDINDFDETLPGAWEWDVKRLVASFAIAARHNEFDASDQIGLAVAATAAYRQAMAKFARMRVLDVWYSRLDVDTIAKAMKTQRTQKERKAAKKFARKARSKDSLHAFRKLAEEVDGSIRIAAQPPLIVPLREASVDATPEALEAAVASSFRSYLASVPDHVAVLLQRFRFTDLALKVVGVGSVGTRCLIVLLEGKDTEDPFFLQIKEASNSVLEGYFPQSAYDNQGERIVVGQRLMQSASDTFLGWTRDPETGLEYFWRQLKDMKGSIDVENASPQAMYRFAGLCGWTLARAHAQSGDSGAISGYLGGSDAFDLAMGRFAVIYADQNERDYARFVEAIRTGQIQAHDED